MNAGPLNTRCRIEARSVTQDAVYGTELVTWTTLATVWCAVQDELPSKSEAVKQGLAIASQRMRVRMRYRTGIDSSMRLVISRPTETTYQIVGGPAILGNKDGLELVVEKYSS
jgi:head-tail adaptor